MERDFRYLRDKHGDAGARDIFEKICVELMTALFGSDAHPIKTSNGDEGIDIIVGDFSSPADIYQCKYFIDGISDSQKSQIRKSFKSSCNSSNYQMKKWILCLPCELTVKEFKWWSEWKNTTSRQKNIQIELLDGAALITKLKKFDIFGRVFDEDIRQQINEIHECFNRQKQKQTDEIVSLLSELDTMQYDDTIFVRKLENANVTEIDGCKRDFFNAELAEQRVRSQGNDENISQIDKLKTKVFSVWETQFRRYKNETNGNELLTRVYERIEDLDSEALSTTLNQYSILAKKGILHQLADECIIGWLSDYKTKLKQYLKEIESNAKKRN